MLQNERVANPEELEQVRIERMLGNLRTASPGIVKEVDLSRQTVTVQLAIQGKIVDQSGVAKWINMPLLTDVPIIWPRAGGFSLTFPVAIGDECLVVFGERCIDSWWQSGGVQKPIDDRQHDLSDAFAIFGPTSQPRKLKNVQANAVELRTDSRSDYISLKNGSLDINIVGAANVKCGSATVEARTTTVNSPSNTINGPLTVTGLITGQGGMTISGGSGAAVTGNMTITGGDVKADEISLKNHRHTGDSGGDTGPAKV